ALNGGDVKDITPEERQRLIEEQKRQPPKSLFDRMRGFSPISYGGGGGDAAYGSPFEMFRDAVRDGVLEALREFVAGGPGGAGGIQRASLGWAGGGGGGLPEMSGGSGFSGGWRRGGPGGGSAGGEQPAGPAPGTTPGSGGLGAGGAPLPTPRPSGLTPGSGVPRIRRSDLSPGQQRSVEAVRGANSRLRPGAGLRERALHAMDRLVNVHGWTPEAASTAVGQAIEESGVTTTAVGDHGTARFMFQWRLDRQAALRRFAANRGVSPYDADANIDFFNEERQRRSAAERNWHRETDLRRGNIIGKFFENYAGPLQGKREQHARDVLRAYMARGAGHEGGSSAPTGWPGGGARRSYSGLSRLADEDAAQSGTDAASFPKAWRKAVDDLAETKTLPKRAAEAGGGGQSATGSVNITLDGFPKGMRARTSMDGLFKEVTVNRPRAMPNADEGN
ncbi:phage tail tip lysozyme, partial [Chelatococcus reniformis]|uniref:phage tail tip lysozyme n=1 Tax=Chelatococcus reniformis TaxID=1494448 RepID=UPI001FCEE220